MASFSPLRRFAAVALLLLSLNLRADGPGIEFSGYLNDERGLVVALKNSATGDSKWVAVGQEFADCKVVRFDEKAESLVVAKGRAEFTLSLAKSAVKKVKMEPTPEIQKRITNNLRQLTAAADQFFLETGKKVATYEDLVGKDKYVKRVESHAGEDYQNVKFTWPHQPAVEVTTGEGFVVSYKP